LHGDGPEFFAFACVLGRRLSASPGPDRVLLCGPGRWCASPTSRTALRHAGWSHLLPVERIAAEHLDKSRTKRHALVFTKLRVLELPYSKVLLLDLDLLPRSNVNMAELLDVQAPAGKFYCAQYDGPEPLHGEVVPRAMRDGYHWSPNAGVMRLDPLPSLQARREQVQSMIAEVALREVVTFLPEQYYLAEKLSGWRHIDQAWNWEVWTEWDDPKMTHPVSLAQAQAIRQGWARNYMQAPCESTPSCSGEVLASTLVWHYSGIGETAPWQFMDLKDAKETRSVAGRRFAKRDPGGVVAVALSEWREVLDALLEGGVAEEVLRIPLQQAVVELAAQAREERLYGGRWRCEACFAYRRHVREIHDLPWEGAYCSADWRQWLCAECIVERLRAAGQSECSCRLF